MCGRGATGKRWTYQLRTHHAALESILSSFVAQLLYKGMGRNYDNRH